MQMLSHVLFLQGQHWTNALWHAQMPLSQLTQALAIWHSSALSQHLNGLGYKIRSVTTGFLSFFFVEMSCKVCDLSCMSMNYTVGVKILVLLNFTAKAFTFEASSNVSLVT